VPSKTSTSTIILPCRVRWDFTRLTVASTTASSPSFMSAMSA